MNVPTFSFAGLTSRAACDEVLVPTRLLRAGLANKDTNLDFDALTGEARADAAHNTLIGVTSNLTATNNQLAELAPGPSPQRTQLAIRQAQLVARQLVLQARGGSGTTGVLAELAEARNAADLEMVDGFLAQLEAHKLTLPA